ncbi:lytic transglycosylase [Roseomonas sp. KE2513]|uniref:lytic transglycosylase domain-containing protein n=1 Tax=Roseomonas sp. KE2513 TaxID=2479202 RepID=UPI0018E053E0|nr:lytic transglycosylase domain-containing protein [Roseomonas sp. KE2513]MBI0537455.1 lytic transglycosylase [Roseomonas sp. KE2513]
MRTFLLAALAAAAVAAAPAKASVSDGTVAAVTECIQAAAALHRLPPGVIAVLLSVEGGSIGRASQNTNATVDIGPMQINQIHLPTIARRWNTTTAAAREALLNNFCANVEAGAWILRREIDGAGGDFWEGVGRYHSRTDVYKTRYLRKVLEHVMRLQLIAVPATRIAAH